MAGAIAFNGPGQTSSSLDASIDNSTVFGTPALVSSNPGNTTAASSISRKGGILDVSSSTFIGNSAGVGGMAYFTKLVTATFANSYIMHNSAVTGGGALVCDPLSQVVLKHSRLARNNASGVGGALVSNGCKVQILQSMIDANTVLGEGGGLFAQGNAR